MKNILIIDAQPLYSDALATLVEDAFPSVSVKQSTNGSEIMGLVRNQSVDLIILDVVVGDRDGMSLAKNILATGYQGKMLFVSSKDYPSLTKAAYELGANGFLNKNESKQTLIDAIVSVSRGYTLFKLNHSKTTKTELSKREAMVFHYLAQGFSNKRISEQLSLSAKTVSTYKTRILKKYNAKSLVELINTVPQLNSTPAFA